MSAQDRADAVYRELLARQGEQWVVPRVERTQRVLDLLDNPQRTYRVIHVTGTNGKTSTSRIIESLLRAHGLRTGLFTSPHLERFTERILVDGEPIADPVIADAWEEIAPIVALVDAELAASGDATLTFFELLTVLAFVAFSDAPIDVLVLEVGMGGSWDSTNAADGDVAVFTPIAVDHADRLGSTPAEIATVKAGIIKPGARVVSARQPDEVARVLRETARSHDARIAFAGEGFELSSAVLAVGGQLLQLRGLADSYPDVYLPLFGIHQAENAALAIAAVESFLGEGTRPIAADILADGLGQVTSPGRLQLIGVHPTVIVDAAHNPHGIRALTRGLQDSFDIDEWGVVLGILADKDAAGMVTEVLPLSAHVFATAPESERANDADLIADIVEQIGGSVTVHPELQTAADAARAWAAEADRRAVIITGSVILAGEALVLARAEDWKGEEIS